MKEIKLKTRVGTSTKRKGRDAVAAGNEHARDASPTPLAPASSSPPRDNASAGYMSASPPKKKKLPKSSCDRASEEAVASVGVGAGGSVRKGGAGSQVRVSL